MTLRKLAWLQISLVAARAKAAGVGSEESKRCRQGFHMLKEAILKWADHGLECRGRQIKLERVIGK